MELIIPIESISLEGSLVIPESPHGLAIFAHGSGSSRHSPRNQFVAEVLQQGKVGTLLFDLLTEREDQDYETRFNIPLLARRLVGVTRWLMTQEEAAGLPLGFFGASTGAAAALIGAAELGDQIKCVVSRGGRPDLAMEILGQVTSPTLLIVGGLDGPVIQMNQEAFDRLKGIKKMEIVPGATHLFEEPGKLAEVAKLAHAWFLKYLK